jgi:outer membrane protein assembly factor BamB
MGGWVILAVWCRRLSRGVALSGAAVALCCSTSASGEVTGAADNLRTGWYPDEPSLAPASVTPSTFGQAFKTQLKGAIMGQPLIANGTLLVVTEDDWAYGLDPITGAVRWEKHVGTPVNSSEIGCPDISPHIGITSTPVIDTASNVAYFVSNAYLKGESGESGWYMHALDLASGSEITGFPVQISGKADNNKNVTLVGNKQLQRPALLMMGGVIYAAFGSHCDFTPYAGLIAGVSSSGHLTTLWAVSEKGGSIWQSGGGLISDGPGQILFTTANASGTPGAGDPQPGPGSKPPEGFLGESVVRLQVQPEGHLKAIEFFSPANNKQLDEIDLDLGSAAPIALPSAYFGTPADPNLVVQPSKTGELYLLNRTELGGMGQGPKGTDKVIAEQGLGVYGGVWDGSAVWPGDGGYVYIPGVSKPNTGSENFDHLRYFKYGVEAGVPKLTVAATSTEEFGFGSGSPTITSSGTSSGSAVLWITHCPYVEPNHCEKAELWAYNAVPVEGKPQRLWNVPIGWASKFSRPEASGGHIYVANTEGQLFSFSGHVLTPSTSTLEMGTVPVGGQQVGEVTFTNTGTPLKVSAVRGPPAPFEATGLPTVGTTLEPGQVIAVHVKLSPTAPGSFTGSLALTTQAGETSVALSGVAPGPPAQQPPPATGGAQTTAALVTSPGTAGTLGSAQSLLSIGNMKLHLLVSKLGHGRRAKVTYTLTTAGRIELVLFRRVISHRCRGGAHTCARYVRTKSSFNVAGHAGNNVLLLNLGRLPPGDYRLSATPTAPPPARTTTRTVAFTVR